MTDDETPLEGGNMSGGVVRVGDTVRRPAGAWTPAVNALLNHLHTVGFHGAPRPLGRDVQGREVLTFIPGTVAWPDHFHRTGSMYAFLAEQAAQGVQPWTRLWREGHGDAWQADTDYINQHEHQWHRALLG